MESVEVMETKAFYTPSDNDGAVGDTVSTKATPKKAGRPKGSRNKTTRAVKELIQEAHPEQMLIRVMKGQKFMRAADAGSKRRTEAYPTLAESISAAQILLRKVAPDIKATEISGPDGAPIQTQHEQIDAVAEKATKLIGTAPDEAINDDDSLRSLQALNYVVAQKAAAEGTLTPPTAPPVVVIPHVEVTPPEAPETPVEPSDPTDIEPGHEINVGAFTLRCVEGDRPGLPHRILAERGGALLHRLPHDVPGALAWLRQHHPETAQDRPTVRETPDLMRGAGR